MALNVELEGAGEGEEFYLAGYVECFTYKRQPHP